MLRSRRTLGITAAAFVLLLLAAAGFYARIFGTSEPGDGSMGNSDGETTASSPTSAGTDVAIPVEGAPVMRDALVVSVTAAGQAEAWRRNTLVAQVGGQVVRLPVRESQVVGAGQLLVGLNPAEFELGVAEAEAGLRTAQAQYRELTVLDEEIRDSTVRMTRDRVARAKSGLEAGEVRLRRAKFDLQRSEVRAPFAGHVASVKVVPGQYVRPGDELLTVVDLDPIKVEVQVLESEVGYLAPGQLARVSFAAMPDQAFGGRIETINPLVESSTRTARVTLSVPNPEGRILPGMYARVALQARRFADRVLVPRAAILERDRRTMLFVYEGNERGGLAKWRYVTTGLANDSLVEIVPNPETEMVRPGERVLTGGHHTLIHDARVRLVEDVKATAGGRPD